MLLRDLLKYGVDKLKEAGGESPLVDARYLLSHVLKQKKEWLIIHDQDEMSSDQIKAFQELISKRVAGYPIAYIVGYREFWNLKLACNEKTIIPQPDTEILVEEALKYASSQAHILDLGTGTGAIALALKSELPKSFIMGIDQNEQIIKLACHNAKLNKLDVQFKVSNWFSQIAHEKFDLIVSNPPYIDPKDPHLKQGDVRFEPRSALVSDNEGLSDLEQIINLSRNFLMDRGRLLVEHGYNQGQKVRDLFSFYSYDQVYTVRDYGGNERVTLGVFNECTGCKD